MVKITSNNGERKVKEKGSSPINMFSKKEISKKVNPEPISYHLLRKRLISNLNNQDF